MSKAEFFVFDVESGGVDVFEDRVVQFFGATADAQGNLIDTWEIFIDPGVEIAQEAVDVHGFSNGFLKENGKQPAEAFAEIRDLFLKHRNHTLVAFNANYDVSILDAEMKRHGVSESFGSWVANHSKIIDGIVIDRHHDRYRKGKRNLATQAAHYGIPFNPDELHDAKTDVSLTAKVTAAILKKFGTPTTEEQAQWYKDWAENFQEYLRRTDPEAVVDSSWPLRVKEEA